jgi:hypothetical protein
MGVAWCLILPQNDLPALDHYIVNEQQSLDEL